MFGTRTSFFLTTLSLSAGACVHAPPTAVQVDDGLSLLPVTEGVWRHVSVDADDGMARNGLVLVGQGAAVLVDPPTSRSDTEALARTVQRRLGVPILSVLLTHEEVGFDDALLGLPATLTVYGAQDTLDALGPVMKGRRGSPVEDAGSFTLAGVEMAVAPTSAGLALWLPASDVLFAGPMLLGEDVQGLPSDVLLSWRDELARMQADLAVEARVVPGFGTPGGADLVVHTRDVMGGGEPRPSRTGAVSSSVR